MTTRSPANLLYLSIYNPTLLPSTCTSEDDDEDAEEQAHILFYTSKERAVSRDRMLRQIGLAKALINFSEIFAPDDQCSNVHSQGRRMIMISPEPDFWIHACVELAKITRPPPISKAKGSKAGTIGKTKGKELALVTDYQEASVNDVALREDIHRGYELFKLRHGSMTHILHTLGQQALELQLERFFTPWAWSWEIEEAQIFGRHLGSPVHPQHHPIQELLDSACPDIPSLIVTPLHVIPSTSFVKAQYPIALSRLISTWLPPPTSPTILDDSLVSSSPDAIKEGDTSPSSFLGMPTSMPSMHLNMNLKLSWPGYLSFKGKRPIESHPKPSAISPPPESSNVDLRTDDVIKRALDDAMSDYIPNSSSPSDNDNEPPLPSEPDSSTSLGSPSDKQSFPPSSPVPPPELSTATVHLASLDNPLQTKRTVVSFLARYPILIAVAGPDPPPSTAMETLCDNVLRILDDDHLGSSSTDTLPTAAKILQPKDRHIISKGNFIHSNETFESKGEQLYIAQRLFESDPDIREVFARGVNPQYWHVAKRGWTEFDGEMYMEVLRKETTLSDVDNVTIGVFRKFMAATSMNEV